jgi:hypothetical protein
MLSIATRHVALVSRPTGATPFPTIVKKKPGHCVIGISPTSAWQRRHQADKYANPEAAPPLPRSLDSAQSTEINTHFQIGQTSFYHARSRTTCIPHRDIRPPSSSQSSSSGRPLCPSQDTISASPTKDTMSSDEAYASFLDKANEDPSASVPQGARTTAADRFVGTKAVDPREEVPASLNSLEEYYVSDTDEPFEPVALNWDRAKTGTWPSVGM